MSSAVELNATTDPETADPLALTPTPTLSSVPKEDTSTAPSLQSEVGQMDRLTQLQDSLDRLAFQMLSSLDALHKKAAFAPENGPEPIPVQRSNVEALPADQFSDMTQQLSTDIVARLKEMDVLASSLSTVDQGPEELARLMAEAQADVEAAEEERQAALSRADTLFQDMNSLFRKVVDQSSKDAIRLDDIKAMREREEDSDFRMA
ncbi:MAG: hypothetical protein DHS80DRAFT_30108 [Piptocephalis tieghemiana]|nr:MAG: hypothetical protein DHS80DRAFT_30108 [Piptocephalis tieghemiana]